MKALTAKSKITAPGVAVAKTVQKHNEEEALYSYLMLHDHRAGESIRLALVHPDNKCYRVNWWVTKLREGHIIAHNDIVRSKYLKLLINDAGAVDVVDLT